MKKEALLVLCLALASSASAGPVLASLRELAPEGAPAVVAPVQGVSVDGPETAADIDSPKWFRRAFRQARKPRLDELSGLWGEAARTLPDGTWQASDHQLDPDGYYFYVAPLVPAQGSVKAGVVALNESWVGELNWLEARRLGRSVRFAAGGVLHSQAAPDMIEFFHCRLHDARSLICRVQTVRRSPEGRDSIDETYRLYRRAD